MSKLSILLAYVTAGMTPVGACAMGGNIQAESGFKSNIAQRGMTKLTDEEYTAAADAGAIDFANDDVGYGLCQWTYPTRKRNLRFFASDQNKSVGDEQTQIEFCISELKTDYGDLWRYLCQTQNLSEATFKVCHIYERPAVENTFVRIRYANELYMKYGDQLVDSEQWAVDSGIQSADHSSLSTDHCLPVIRRGDKSPEARYLADKLAEIGYDVLWSGLWACVVDYQQKTGLTVDGVCGAETWKKLMHN